MDKEKAKILDNYQLYQLINSNLVDKNLLETLQNEFNSRQIGEQELSRLKLKFNQLNNIQVNNSEATKELNPIITPFLIKKHFQNIAKLNASGKTKEAKLYQLKLNIGLILEGIIVVSALLLYYKYK